jgi:very-short-patch-repair endonuclease
MPRRPGPPSLAQLDDRPFPTLRLTHAMPPSQVAARVRGGEWVRVRRGVYLDAGADAADPHRMALARALGAHACLGGTHVLSHTSAALVAGLPLRTPPERVHVTQPWRPRSQIADDVVRHVRRLPAAHLTTVRGVRVTSLARTLADCATSLPALDGLIVMDAGLHVGVARGEVEDIVRDLVGRRGVVRARAVLAAADDGAESPGETWMRWVFLCAGLPPPETQLEVETRLGPRWADLGWRAWRLLVEYDGRQKYGEGRDATERLLAERRRQEALEEEGWRVVRVLKEDLRSPRELVRRVLRLVPGTPRLEPRDLLAL